MTKPITFGEALIALGFESGWVTYGTWMIAWPGGEPKGFPGLEAAQKKFVEMGGTLVPEPGLETLTE